MTDKINLKYDRERLRDLITDFCIITKVSVSVVNADFVTLATYSEKTPPFCEAIQNADGGKEKCICSDIKLLEECRRTGHMCSHICHAGIMDAVIPLVKSGVVIGYILVGRIRVKDFDEIYENINWLANGYDKMKKYYSEMNTYNAVQINSLLELASMMVSFILTNDIIKPEYDPIAEQAEAYITSNIKEKLSIDGLCRKLGVSKNRLYHSFHKMYGCTVNEYITEKRLDMGRMLLETTDYSVARIAEETGISSYTYFSRLFRETYKISPLKYRKLNKEKIL